MAAGQLWRLVALMPRWAGVHGAVDQMGAQYDRPLALLGRLLSTAACRRSYNVRRECGGRGDCPVRIRVDISSGCGTARMRGDVVARLMSST